MSEPLSQLTNESLWADAWIYSVPIQQRLYLT